MRLVLRKSRAILLLDHSHAAAHLFALLCSFLCHNICSFRTNAVAVFSYLIELCAMCKVFLSTPAAAFLAVEGRLKGRISGHNHKNDIKNESA